MLLVHRDQLAVRGGHRGGAGWTGADQRHFTEDVAGTQPVDLDAVDAELDLTALHDVHVMRLVTLDEHRGAAVVEFAVAVLREQVQRIDTPGACARLLGDGVMNLRRSFALISGPRSR